MNETCGGFAISHYRELLQTALELGYRLGTFSGFENLEGPRVLLMRHDIDLSVDLAYGFAVLEQELGVRATYFVRLHAHNYNPFEYHTYRKLKEMEAMGHELGLHYEPGFADAVGEDPAGMVRREKVMLEALLGHEVSSAAAHLPAKSGRTITEENLSSFGFKHEAYLPRFTEGFKYLSDSNGRWREGCLCGHLGRHDRLCVLVHPFWWFHRSPVENY